MKKIYTYVAKDTNKEAKDYAKYLESEEGCNIGDIAIVFLCAKQETVYFVHNNIYGEGNQDEKRIMMRSPIIEGNLSEEEFELFQERVSCFREAVSLAEICKKYPDMSEENIVKASLRALERMQLQEDEKVIARKFLSGNISKKQLIEEGYSLTEIEKALQKLSNALEYYAYSEYEKRVLRERGNTINAGPIEVLYSVDSFAEKYDISPEVITLLDMKILSNQKVLSQDEKEKMGKFLLCEEEYLKSYEDKALMNQLSNKIVEYFQETKKKLYLDLATKLIEKKMSNTEIFEFCVENDYNYSTLCEEYKKMYKKTPEYKEKQRQLRKERLRRYLDEY